MNTNHPEASEVVSFDAALEKLQQLVRGLEGGTLSLEDSLKTFEEGVRLARSCQSHLVAAEQRVEQLLRMPEDGSPPQSTPFSDDKL